LRLLRFRGVSDLQIHARLDIKQPLEIDWIDRSESTRPGFNDFHWTIRLHGYPQREPNLIEFNGADFVQELTAPPVFTATRGFLSWTERVKMIKEFGEQTGGGAG